MSDTIELSKTDTGILLRVVGSRKGADFAALSDFLKTHKRNPATDEQIRESLARLIEIGIVLQQGATYVGKPDVQAAFFAETRNCRDTIEEFSVLSRVLNQFYPDVVPTK